MSAAATEALGERLMNAFNEAALTVMLSIGHRSGLLDTLAGLPAVTSAELAEAAGLDERYVREWLDALTAGRIVQVEPTSRRYTLPAEHAALLTRAATPNNLAAVAQYIPLLGSMEDKILACFHDGGGVPYEEYPRFHEVMAEDSGQSVLSVLFSDILPIVPGLSDRLEQGIDVLDAGCGRGRALLAMAERFPRSRFVGYDLSAEATAWASGRAAERNLDNVRFEARDLSDFDEVAEEEAFDLVTTFDAVHDQAKPLALLRGIRRSLRPDGVYLMQDIHGSSHVHHNLDHPLGTFLYTISTFHCMSVSLAQGGEGLGTMWGREKARELLRQAEFGEITVQQLSHDPFNDYYVIRP